MPDRPGTLPRWLFTGALLLPLGAIVAGIVRAEHHLATAAHWVFEIEGYDPRDLLRGHYIEFRLELHEHSAASSHCGDLSPQTCCYCLERQSEQYIPLVTRMSCQEAASCDGRLDVAKAADVRRFYVAEARAAELERQLRDAAVADRAQVVLAIDAQGTPQIVELRVNGKSVEHATPP